MLDHLDCVVIGAGVIGLAIARALAMSGREVTILEKHEGIGTQTSSRNSEVIHAGIYYQKNSIKSQACINGKELLYQYCNERNIQFNHCGKLIVATAPDEIDKLVQIRDNAADCDVSDLVLLNKRETLTREPALNAYASLWSPSSGIIDSHAFMLALLTDIENENGQFVPFSEIAHGEILEGSQKYVFKLSLTDGYTFTCNTLINASGLDAQSICAKLKGFPPKYVPPLYLAKGSYFALQGKSLFSCLIYPVPTLGGLGTHLTLDLNGQARFGPNVQWVEEINYDVNPADRDGFYEDIRRYWPDVCKEKLIPAYAGIRPKLAREGAPAADFIIQGRKSHGISGLVNLFGIESPGLTASLAIAKIVENTLDI